MAADQSTGNLRDLIDPGLVSDLKRLEFRTKRLLDAHLIGQYRSAFRGSGLVYSDLREYQAGDEVKRIHWKASARSNKVFVKSYDEDRLLNIMLLIDISRSTLYGYPRSRHNRAFEFAALVAMMAQKSEDALGLCLFSDQVEQFMPPRRSRTQFQRVILSLLEHRTLRTASNLSRALENVNRDMKRRGIVFVISDFFCPPFADQLKRLSYKHDVIAVMLEDSPQTQLPRAGLVEYTDAETGELFTLDTGSPFARKRFHAAQKKHREDVIAVCTSSQADFMAINDNVLQPLMQLMKKRASRISSHSAGFSR